MAYVEDIYQEIYTKCHSEGLDKLNKGLQDAIMYSGSLEQSLKQLNQVQKMGIDFHARNVNAQKELLLSEKQKIQLTEAETKSRIRLQEYEEKYEAKKAKRNEAELKHLAHRNSLWQKAIRLAMAYFSIQTLKNIIDTGSKLQLIQKSIEGLTKSSQDWQFIQEQAFKMGVSLETVARGYRNFYSAANMAGFGKGNIQQMYGDLLLSSRAIGASQQQTEGALLALEQMISKGTVSMEELRRQLGNALPGAFEIGAKAMNMTTKEFNSFVKTGKLASVEFVPKFIKTLKETYANGFTDIEQTVSVASGRLKVAWETFTLDFLSGDTGKAFAEVINSIANLLMSSEFKQFVAGLGTIFKWINKIILVTMPFIKYLLRNLPIVLMLLGVGGLYGLMQKHALLQLILNARWALSVKWMKLFGITSIKSFAAANKGALALGKAFLKALMPILVIQDVLLWIVGTLTGTKINTITGELLGLTPQIKDIAGGWLNLAKDPLKPNNTPEYFDYLRKKGQRGIVGDMLDGLLGLAAPISGNYQNDSLIPNNFSNNSPIIPNSSGYLGTLPNLGNFSKEQELSTNVNIGDINIYSSAANPQEVAKEVREQLIALFIGQGLITNVEEFA